MASMAVAMQRSGCAFQGAPPLRFLLLFAGIRCGALPRRCAVALHGGTPACACCSQTATSLRAPWPDAVSPAAALPATSAPAPGSVRDPQLERFYEPLRPVPALHIIGDKARRREAGLGGASSCFF